MSLPRPPNRSMYRLRVGGKDGITPSLDDPTSYLEIARCGDGTVRVSIHVYIDPLGGEPIPSKPVIINGVPKYKTDASGSLLRPLTPELWPPSRLFGETHIADSLQTIPVQLYPGGPITNFHIGGFARVTLARTPSLDDALEKYRVRDTRTSHDLHGDPDDLSPDSPPFIPSTASITPRASILSHNLPPSPSGDPP